MATDGIISSTGTTNIGTLYGGTHYTFDIVSPFSNPIGPTTYTFIGVSPYGFTIPVFEGIVTGTYNYPFPIDNYTSTIRASNNGQILSINFTWSGRPSPATTVDWVSPAEGSLPQAVGLSAYKLTSVVNVTNPVGSTVFTVSSGQLPTGTSLNSSTGVVSGTLWNNLAYNYDFTLRATNNNVSSDRRFTGSIVKNNTTITWVSPVKPLGTFKSGSDYTFNFKVDVVNPVGPTTYEWVSGFQPVNGTLNTTTGVLSGTVTIPYAPNLVYVFSVSATNNNVTEEQSFGYRIGPGDTLVTWLTPTAGTLSVAAGGSNYNFTPTINVDNPVGSTVFTLQSGNLPKGTFLNSSTGAITGTLPNSPDSYTFTLRATNNNKYAERNFNGIISGKTEVTWNTPFPALPATSDGSVFTFVPNVTVANGVGATTYSLVSGSLPNGAILNPSTGIIAGKLTNSLPNYSFTIRATNNGVTADRQFSLPINVPPVWITPAGQLVNGVVGESYNTTLVASSAISYAVVVGTLPKGLTLNTQTGAITGTPIEVTQNASLIKSFPNMTSDSNPSGYNVYALATVTGTSTLTSSGVLQTPNTAYKIFDNEQFSMAAFNQQYGSSITFPFILGVSSTYKVNVSKYDVTCYTEFSGANSIKNWSLQGSDDGITWVSVDTRSNTTWPSVLFGKLSFTLPKEVSYYQYRLNITDIGEPTTHTMLVSELEFYGYSNAFTVRATSASGLSSDRQFGIQVNPGTTSIAWKNPAAGAQGSSAGGSLYKFTSEIIVTNPVGPTTYELIDGKLPLGTFLDVNTGVITGTLTNSAYDYTFTLRATNNGKQADRNFTGSVTDSTTIVSWNRPLAGPQGVSAGGSLYNFISNTTVINPVGPTTYEVISGNLPLGTILNSSTGVITGTLTNTAYDYRFTLRVKNNGKQADRDFTGSVTDTNTYIRWQSPNEGLQPNVIGGSPYIFAANTVVTNPVGPTTYALISGKLPEGTVLNPSTGSITGTVLNSTFNYTFTLRATNNGKQADRNFYGAVSDTRTSIKWQSPSEGPQGSSAGGSLYTFISNTAVTNPVGPTTYEVISGKIPLGTVLNANTGIITGTLTNTAYNYTFTLRATNNSVPADRLFTGSVTDTNTYIKWKSPIEGLQGTFAGGSSYRLTPEVEVTNPVGLTTYALVSGKLPDGTNLNASTGIISGILTNAANSFTFTIRATNNFKQADRNFTVLVSDTNTYINWKNPNAGLQGTFLGGSVYKFTSEVTVTNPSGLTTYTLVSGILPLGTRLDAATGIISGILTNKEDSYTFTLRATNNNKSAERNFTVLVSDTNTYIKWQSPNEGSQGVSKGDSLYTFISNTIVTNPVGPTTYALIAGSLPLGTKLDANTGIITGTLTNSAYDYTFTLRATNNTKQADRTFTGSVTDSTTIIYWIKPDAGLQGTFAGGSSYKFISNTSVTNPVGPTIYAVVSGALPNGTKLNTTTGVISGILTNAINSFTFTIRAANNGKQADRNFTVLVSDTNTYIKWQSPSEGPQGASAGGSLYTFISNTIVTNPVGPTTYELISGKLPDGTTLNPSTGTITGTLINVAAPYTFTLRAKNNGKQADRIFTGSVTDTNTYINWQRPNEGMQPSVLGGASYTFISNTNVTNPVGPTTYSLVSGSLPLGTNLDTATGIISGTLTNKADSYIFTLRATNNNKSADRNFTVPVTDTNTYIRWQSPSEGARGASKGGSLYTFISNTVVTNPVGPTTYELIGGKLPDGTTLNPSTGTITGTLVNTAYDYTFTLRATNNGKQADRFFTGSVTDTNTYIRWQGPNEGMQTAVTGGSLYKFTSNTAVTNPVGTTIYTLLSGKLPLGTNLDKATGIISGTLTNAADSYIFTLRATNNNKSADRNFTVPVIDTNTYINWKSPDAGLQGTFSGGSVYKFTSNTTVTNPVGPTTYALISGTLPFGTILNASTGIISGTLTNKAGTYLFTLQATNNKKVANRTFSVIVADTNTTIKWLKPSEGLFPSVIGGSTYKFVSEVSVTNPVGLTTYTIISGKLPIGAILDKSTGIISGLLANFNYDYDYSFTINASNNNKSASRSFTGKVLCTKISWISPIEGFIDKPIGTTVYSLVLKTAVTNPVGPTTYSLISGRLPLGTTLGSSTGVISGTLTNTANTYTFTIRATNNGKQVDRIITVSPLPSTIVEWKSPAAGIQTAVAGGSIYKFISNVSVTNPIGSTIYTLVSGTLPDGTKLYTSNGTISGTLPNLTKSYTFTIRATNNGVPADRLFTVPVSAATVVIWNSPSEGIQGTFLGGTTYSFISNVSVTNPVGPTIYTVISGSVPAGTTLNAATGVISGTLTNSTNNYSYPFTIRATNNNKSAERQFTVSVVPTTVVKWESPIEGLQPAVAGGASYTFISNTTVTNPVGPTTYAVVLGNLPLGTTLNATTGVISGTLTNTTNSYTFTIRATNNSKRADRIFTVQVTSATVVTWNSPLEGIQPEVSGGSPYVFNSNTSVINAVGATTYSIILGNVPDGTTFNANTGAITGTLTNRATTYLFTIRATNNGKFSDRKFTVPVVSTTEVKWNSPAEGAQGVSSGGSIYTFISNVAVTNPVGLTVFSIISGSIPLGTTFNTSTGAISGTLTNSAYSYSFTIRATNNGKSAERVFSGSVINTTSISWKSPNTGLQPELSGGTVYKFTPMVEVINPVGPTTYSIISGKVPDGTTLNADGTISGTLLNMKYDYLFTVRATNNTKIADREFFGLITTSTVVKWNSPAEGAQGVSSGGSLYTFISNVAVTNPIGPTTFSIISGSVPLGTTFNAATGAITGTLTNSGYTYTFTIRATNNSKFAERVFSGSIFNTTSVKWNSPAEGIQPAISSGSTYRFVSNTTATNGVGATTYSIASGSLPTGTTLNPTTGIISGTVSGIVISSTFNFTIRATNNTKYADRSFIVPVNVATVVTWNLPLEGIQPAVLAGSLYTFTSNVSVSNMVGATTYSLIAGSLPNGTTLNSSTGVISGTVGNIAKSYIFTLRATNNGKFAERIFTVPVTSNTIVQWNSPAEGIQPAVSGGSTYRFVCNTTITNGWGSTIYSIASGSLPLGTTLDSATGIISGTVQNFFNTYTFTIRATNNTTQADRNFIVPVNPVTVVIWNSPSIGAQGTSIGGTAYSLISNVSVINPDGPTTFSVISGQLPFGTTLNPTTGVVSGTLTNSAYNYTFTIKATNNGKSADRPFTGSVTLAAAPTTINWAGTGGSLGSTAGGGYWSFTPILTISNPVGPTVFSILPGGTIPVGTSLNTTNGYITGQVPNPNFPYNYAFTMRITNNGVVLDRSFTGTIKVKFII